MDIQDIGCALSTIIIWTQIIVSFLALFKITNQCIDHLNAQQKTKQRKRKRRRTLRNHSRLIIRSFFRKKSVSVTSIHQKQATSPKKELVSTSFTPNDIVVAFSGNHLETAYLRLDLNTKIIELRRILQRQFNLQHSFTLYFKGKPLQRGTLDDNAVVNNDVINIHHELLLGGGSGKSVQILVKWIQNELLKNIPKSDVNQDLIKRIIHNLNRKKYDSIKEIVDMDPDVLFGILSKEFNLSVSRLDVVLSINELERICSVHRPQPQQQRGNKKQTDKSSKRSRNPRSRLTKASSSPSPKATTIPKVISQQRRIRKRKSATYNDTVNAQHSDGHTSGSDAETILQIKTIRAIFERFNPKKKYDTYFAWRFKTLWPKETKQRLEFTVSDDQFDDGFTPNSCTFSKLYDAEFYHPHLLSVLYYLCFKKCWALITYGNLIWDQVQEQHFLSYTKCIVENDAPKSKGKISDHCIGGSNCSRCQKYAERLSNRTEKNKNKTAKRLAQTFQGHYVCNLEDCDHVNINGTYQTVCIHLEEKHDKVIPTQIPAQMALITLRALDNYHKVKGRDEWLELVKKKVEWTKQPINGCARYKQTKSKPKQNKSSSQQLQSTTPHSSATTTNLPSETFGFDSNLQKLQKYAHKETDAHSTSGDYGDRESVTYPKENDEERNVQEILRLCAKITKIANSIQTQLDDLKADNNSNHNNRFENRVNQQIFDLYERILVDFKQLETNHWEQFNQYKLNTHLKPTFIEISNWEFINITDDKWFNERVIENTLDHDEPQQFEHEQKEQEDEYEDDLDVPMEDIDQFVLEDEQQNVTEHDLKIIINKDLTKVTWNEVKNVLEAIKTGGITVTFSNKSLSKKQTRKTRQTASTQNALSTTSALQSVPTTKSNDKAEADDTIKEQSQQRQQSNENRLKPNNASDAKTKNKKPETVPDTIPKKRRGGRTKNVKSTHSSPSKKRRTSRKRKSSVEHDEDDQQQQQAQPKKRKSKRVFCKNNHTLQPRVIGDNEPCFCDGKCQQTVPSKGLAHSCKRGKCDFDFCVRCYLENTTLNEVDYRDTYKKYEANMNYAFDEGSEQKENENEEETELVNDNHNEIQINLEHAFNGDKDCNSTPMIKVGDVFSVTLARKKMYDQKFKVTEIKTIEWIYDNHENYVFSKPVIGRWANSANDGITFTLEEALISGIQGQESKIHPLTHLILVPGKSDDADEDILNCVDVEEEEQEPQETEKQNEGETEEQQETENEAAERQNVKQPKNAKIPQLDEMNFDDFDCWMLNNIDTPPKDPLIGKKRSLFDIDADDLKQTMMNRLSPPAKKQKVSDVDVGGFKKRCPNESCETNSPFHNRIDQRITLLKCCQCAVTYIGCIRCTDFGGKHCDDCKSKKH